jgi:hypothetical protein
MNAKDEFLSHIGNRKVKCALILIDEIKENQRFLISSCAHTPINEIYALLTTGWDNEDWVQFLDLIDVEYDNGHGSQYLRGTIWYEDGTWSQRREYDGKEWFEYCVCPVIPEELNRIDKIREKKLNNFFNSK